MGLNAAIPWCLMLSIQYGSPGAAVPDPIGLEHEEPKAMTGLTAAAAAARRVRAKASMMDKRR